MSETNDTRRWVNCGEGPFDSEEEAREFADAEVGVEYRIDENRNGWIVLIPNDE